MVIFITLFAFIYIVGEAITTLADLGLWWIFNKNIFLFFLLLFIPIIIPTIIILTIIFITSNLFFILLILLALLVPLVLILSIHLYKPFINKACAGSNSETQGDSNSQATSQSQNDSSKSIEYITFSCSLKVDDFMEISNKTDNYFLQESERYFDYSLFFGSVGLACFICLFMLKINLYNFLWIIIFLILSILSLLLAIYNRFKANLFLKLAAKSVEDITTNRN